MHNHRTSLDSYREWSSDEIERFEEGLREYGKDFFKLTMNKVTDRFSSIFIFNNSSSVLIELYEK